MIRQQKRHLIICGLICITLIILSSCETVKVFIKEDPEILPTPIEKIIFENDYSDEISNEDNLKSIIKEYKSYIQDIRWNLLYITVQLITENITPDEYNEKVKPLQQQLNQFETDIKKFQDSLLLN